MTRLLLIVVFTFTVSVPVFGQNTEDISGYWEGAIVRENSIQTINVTFVSDDKAISGSYSMPELGLYEQPLREPAVSDSLVRFRILYGPFDMRYFGDINQMTGINNNWNPPVSIHLKKGDISISKVYESEEVIFYNKDVMLYGMLIKPPGKGPFPGIVVVHGGGDQGLHEWEYRSHGYTLAQKGIAALLYDKRGVGRSTGDFRAVSFEELADDAIAGMNVLRSRADIVKSAVGLLGVSQGGWISAIASRKTGKPAFAVMLQGPAVSLEEQEFHRVKYSMLADGFSKTSIDSAISHTGLYFKYVNEKIGWDALTLTTEAAKNSTWADYIIYSDSEDDPDLDWWRNNAYDPADDLKSFEIPVLSIFGEFDTAVPPEENKDRMEKYLIESGVNFQIVVIPELPHSVTTFQGLYGGDNWNWPDVFWKWAQRPFGLDEKIADWIFNHK